MKKRLSRRSSRSSWRWGRGFRRRGLPFRVRPRSMAHSAHAEHLEGLLAVPETAKLCFWQSPYQSESLAHRLGWRVDDNGILILPKRA